MLGAPTNCSVFDFVWLGSLVNHLMVGWWFGFGFLGSPYGIGLLLGGTPGIPKHQPQPKQPICHAFLFVVFDWFFSILEMFFAEVELVEPKQTPIWYFMVFPRVFFSRRVEEA